MRRSRAYRDSLAIRERLAAADRSNTGWQRDLSVSLQQGRRRAGGAGQARRGAQEPTATASPSPSAWPPPIPATPIGSAISRCRTNRIGDVLVAQGKLDEALKRYRDSLAIAERLAARRSRQHRLAARSRGVVRQDRRRAGGAGQARRGAQELPG